MVAEAVEGRHEAFLVALDKKHRKFVDCRELGHAWAGSRKVKVGDKERGKIITVGRELACARCGTTRSETLSVVSGTVMKRRYDYPDGYASPGGRIYRDECRIVVVKAALRTLGRGR